MGFQYIPIERVKTISKKDFYHNYYLKQKPVVVEELTRDWPAYEKWSLQYIKQLAGDREVPLYNNDPVDYTKKVNEPVARMSMGEYVDILNAGPTDLRIFLYNILKDIPARQTDFEFPDLGLKLFKSLPLLFFGGEGSNVFMHFDIDLANILHFHFNGKKRCVILPPTDSKYMYKLPFSNICREDIDFDNPDFKKWPALQKVTPYVADLSHGEMLYMPEGWWHYMKYLTPGFSMSLRSLAKRPKNFLHAVNNVFVMRNIDNVMRKVKGKEWLEHKDRKAVENTHALLNG